ncbi:MAG: hypothetical protein ACYS18_04790 [Planctomycetota bacterium]|jgi:hypothetical protein
MGKKGKWDSIAFVLAVLIMGVVAFGAIVKPESIGDFIRDFWKAFFALIAIPLLVIFWWEWGVEVSKKRFYFWCGFVVFAAAVTIWSLCSLNRERPMIDKVYSLVMPFWFLAVGLIPIIKYIKAQRSKQVKKNK